MLDLKKWVSRAKTWPERGRVLRVAHQLDHLPKRLPPPFLETSILGQISYFTLYFIHIFFQIGPSVLVKKK